MVDAPNFQSRLHRSDPKTLSLVSYSSEPLLLPAVGVVGGILFGNSIGAPLWLCLAAAILTAALLYFARRKGLAIAFSLAITALFFWLAAARTGQVLSRPKPLGNAAPRELVILEGCIVSPPQIRTSRLDLHLEVAPGARVRLTQYSNPEQTLLSNPLPRLFYGQRIRTTGRMRPVRNQGNPGNFDAERYFAHRQIYWSATVPSRESITALEGSCGNPVRGAIYRFRQAILDRVQTLAAGDPYVAAMMSALTVGDQSHLERAWTEGFRRTNTYHALVISGLHVGLLAGFLLTFLRAFPLPKSWTHIVAGSLILFYAFLCDLSPPVLRATGGFLLFLLAKSLYRKTRILNTLSAVAVLFLLWDPEQLFEGSFLLSFLAVLALGALASPIEANTLRLWSQANFHLERPELRLPDPRAASIRVELHLVIETLRLATGAPRALLARALQACLHILLFLLTTLLNSAVMLIGLSLPMVLLFHRLSLISLLANLPVVFLLSWAVLFSFLTLFTGPLLMPVVHWLIHSARATVDWHLQFDPGIRLPDPPLWLLLALPLSLLYCAMAWRKNWTTKPLATALPVLCFLALFLAPQWQKPDLRPGLLELSAIDIGQGDSLFLSSPDGHLALVDGGGGLSGAFDPGESILSPYLWSRRIRRLDTIIVSHSDQDHAGGLAAVIDNFQPREVWASCLAQGPAWERMRQRAGARVRYLAAGDTRRLGDLSVDVLWPPCERQDLKSNDASLVLLLRHGKHQFLLTGDIEAKVEAELLSLGKLPKVDVLKVAHHGSRTSTTPAFLHATQPALALISAGFANSFGHPHPKTLERLREHGTQTWRTDQHGQIRVFSDGSKLHVESFHQYRTQWRRWHSLLPEVE
jgi:competence protein ComEC